MKEWRRYKTKKQLRRAGRKVRRWRRFNKWLEAEACEALNVIEDIIYNLNAGMPKVGNCIPGLPKALVHSVPVEQLKKYLSLNDWWEKNELFLEIQGVIHVNKMPEHIMSIVNEIKDKSIEQNLSITEVVHDELYGRVQDVLYEHIEEPPQWMDIVLYGTSYMSYLHDHVSNLYIPQIDDLFTAICHMGYGDQVIDFYRWDKQVRETIADGLGIYVPDEMIIWSEDSIVPMNKTYWEVIRYVIKSMLPDLYRDKLNDMKEFEKMLDKQELKKFIKDFDLKPI